VTAFLLTWKETGWPHENIVRMLNTLEAQGYVDEPWRLAAHNQARQGDRVFVLKQGRGPKGIFGRGEITGAPFEGEAGNGKVQWMAPVRFDAFVDPKQQLLLGEPETAAILRTAQMNAQASGYALDDAQEAALDTALAAQPVIELGGSGDWTPAEIAAIVADYFSMLDAEVAGQPYNKTEHRNALQKIVQRSSGSIERKHQNISAVLQNLSLPWIQGYKPLANFQDALVTAVERRLDKDIVKLDQPTAAPPSTTTATVDEVFVAPPKAANMPAKSGPMVRLARKFDPAMRDAANRKLGCAGEEFVERIERERLRKAGRDDLAKKVEWVSKSQGDGLGYDIESFETDGTPIVIEVKTTKGPIQSPFFLSENERSVAAERGASYRLYRVFKYGDDPKIYSLKGPLDPVLLLQPVSYRARVAGDKI
jgi:hypothetical protein